MSIFSSSRTRQFLYGSIEISWARKGFCGWARWKFCWFRVRRGRVTTLCHKISVKFEFQIFQIHFAILSFEISPLFSRRQPKAFHLTTTYPDFGRGDTVDCDEFPPKTLPRCCSLKLDDIEHELLRPYGKSEFNFTIVQESYTSIFRVGNFHSFLDIWIAWLCC